jgi:hypothetical protein
MDNPYPNPAPDWLSGQAWADLCELDGIAEVFHGIRDNIMVRALRLSMASMTISW